MTSMFDEQVCEYDGIAVAQHGGACMLEPYGPSSDFGWQHCHGCERVDDRWSAEWNPNEHEPDCPGRCLRLFCLPHGKSDWVGHLRQDRKTLLDEIASGWFEASGQLDLAKQQLVEIEAELRLFGIQPTCPRCGGTGLEPQRNRPLNYGLIGVPSRYTTGGHDEQPPCQVCGGDGEFPDEEETNGT